MAAGTVGRSGYYYGNDCYYDRYYGSYCGPSYWCGYYDPYCHGGWGYGGYWGPYWGVGYACGPFSWSLSLWPSLWCYNSWYWDSCYWNSFCYAWSYPYAVSSSYWWYPSSTYCPTYLYVPSTSVIYVGESASPAPAAEPGVAAARPGLVEEARAGVPARPTDELAANLAKKYVELGDFYFRANRFPEAAEAYGKARSFAPDDGSVHFVLADAVFADGDYLYAAFLIAEGLRLAPELAAAEADKRLFYGDAKTFDAHMAALDAHLAKSPNDVPAHFVRGYNLAFSGQPVAALVAFRRVLELEPTHKGASAFVAAIEARGKSPAPAR